MNSSPNTGRLNELKLQENNLYRLLETIRHEKQALIRSRPLKIGVVGFGRFGQFIAKTFTKYGRVVATSRSDHSAVADAMGVTYIPWGEDGNLEDFVAEGLDVIVLAVSIVSFEETIKKLVPVLEADVERRRKVAENCHLLGPLIVDVLSVKDYPRQIMLDLLPMQCDVLCTHPMFGPDSGKNGWFGLNFVYERTRIDGCVLDPSQEAENEQNYDCDSHQMSEAHILGKDRMERFLSIWEEEGCRMVALSCKGHDEYAANSQFITHLMGRILDVQGLKPTPIDTKGFESVLKLVCGTTADSFDLFFGLYKYNKNSIETIKRLQDSMDGVVAKLKEMDEDNRNIIEWVN